MAAYKVRLEDGSEMGPLDMEMMRSWYQQGLIARDSKVRRTNGKQWVPLIDAVDISSWGAAGGTKGGAAESEDEVEELYDYSPQTWRMFVASALFFLVAAGAGYFAMYPDRWLPALRQAPWREIALGQVVLGLLLLRGWEPGRKIVRVLVFLLTFSLFAVAAPVLLQGFQWRPVAILVSAWVMGSGLFFWLAGRPLRWSSIAMCLFWIFAGAAGIGYLGYVPPGSASPVVASAGQSAPDDRLAAPWSPSATAVTLELPLLSPRAAELVVSYGLDRPEAAFKKSYLLAANGVGRLSPAGGERARTAHQRRLRAVAAAQPPPPRRVHGAGARPAGDAAPGRPRDERARPGGGPAVPGAAADALSAPVREGPGGQPLVRPARLPSPDHRQLPPRVGVVGLDAERLLEMACRLVEAAAQRERPAEVVVSVERAGVRLRRAAELLDRLHEVAGLEERAPEIVARRGIVRREPHGLAQMR